MTKGVSNNQGNDNVLGTFWKSTCQYRSGQEATGLFSVAGTQHAFPGYYGYSNFQIQTCNVNNKQ